MEELYERTALVLGEEAIPRLKNARVAVFGAGGVGGAVIEALARAGIGYITIIDGDKVAASNINRQILYTTENIGNMKAGSAGKRILAINPACTVEMLPWFYAPGDEFEFSSYDYIADAVDDVKAKVAIAASCRDAGRPLIAAMGAANKVDPTRFQVADIYDTKVCPLAKTMRKEYKAAGIEHLKVVYSTEPPVPMKPGQKNVGSVSFVPPVMGYIMAGEIIRAIVQKQS